jgi:Mg-chelatase subunit ChlD
MKNVSSYKITDTLYLNNLFIDTARPAAPTSVNHIAIVDCSGSMYGELDKLRASLKAKLPKLLREGDTLSLIWFSGRGQFGPILEGETIASLRDLANVNRVIDLWLRPQGLTGFKEPLDEAVKMITRVSQKNKNPFALFFMSDGMDNQWPRADVLKAVERVAGNLVSSTFVEYGNYADRQMLTAMAERAGVVLDVADDYFCRVFHVRLFRCVASVGRRCPEGAVLGDGRLRAQGALRARRYAC